MPRDEATVLDLKQAAERILEFTRGQDKPAFAKDFKTQSAVLHQITIIGEAVKRLSKDFKNRSESIPWSDIARMRDKLIHHYDNVDLDRVWDAVELDIPKLLQDLQPLLPKKET